MTINASGRSALIIAAGIVLCCAGPLHAAELADGETVAASSDAPEAAGAPVKLSTFTKHHVRHWTRHASAHVHGSTKLAAKTSKHRKIVEADTVKDDNAVPSIPDHIANAQARASDADVATPTTIGTVSTQADKMLQTMNAQPDTSTDAQGAAQVVAADELNDVDRALVDTTAPAEPTATAAATELTTNAPAEAAPATPPAVTMAAADPPAVVETPTVVTAAVASDDSAWGKSSLIGKIFIGFGGLLTLASAARMFLA